MYKAPQGIGYGAAKVGQLVCLCTRLGFVGSERVFKELNLMLFEDFYEVLFSIMYIYEFVELPVGRTLASQRPIPFEKPQFFLPSKSA
jgi:hypothetical protein